jgi:hypothetical protein
VAGEAALILRTLDRHLTGPAHIRLLGGAALILAYGMGRSTEDADLLQDDAEMETLIEQGGFAEAVEATNAELAPTGLYLTHIWGPEQQILTPSWRVQCRPIRGLALQHLEVSALGPLDLIVSKLCRADTLDMADIEHVIRHEALTAEQVREALAQAQVPAVFQELFPSNRQKVEELLRRVPAAK